MAQAPPRHGKSEFLSRWVPTWWHCVYPDLHSILSSYSVDLARIHSRRVRDQVDMYSWHYGLNGVNPAVSGATEWEIAGHKGRMKAAGVGGGLTGHGAHLFIVDDYLKNAEQATSPKVRDAQWEWLQTVAITRWEPGAKMVVLATRWHDDDLIGRLLKSVLQSKDYGFRVREIRLPALAEPTDTHPDPLGRATDEALWPERISAESLKRKRAVMDPYWWNALFQQRLGTYGKNEWPVEYFYGIFANDDEWPEHFSLSAVALDPSKGKDAKKGDPSAIVFCGFHNGYLWFDCNVERRPVPKMMRDLVAFNEVHRPTVTGIESVAFQELLATDYQQAQIEAGDYRDEPVLIENTISKSLRIARIGTWLRLHRVKIRRSTGGIYLQKQLSEWPYSENDDAADAMEMAIRLLCSLSESLDELRKSAEVFQYVT